MNRKTVREILKNTDYIRVSGSAEEKQAAAYLQGLCEAMGVKAFQESFDVDVAEIKEAALFSFAGARLNACFAKTTKFRETKSERKLR